MLLLLAPLVAGVFGWFWPSGAWCGVGVAFLPAMQLSMAFDRGDISEGALRRLVLWAIGYGVLLGVAGPVGAWLAP
jgi:hypothetical protein